MGTSLQYLNNHLHKLVEINKKVCYNYKSLYKKVYR